MPSDFFINQAEYSLIYPTDPEIKKYFDALDLTVYSFYGRDNLTLTGNTFPDKYSSYYDAPNAPQWNTSITDRYFEIVWEYQFSELSLTFRDTRHWVIWEGFWEGNTVEEALKIRIVEGQEIGYLFTRDSIVQYLGDEEEVNLVGYGKYLSANIRLFAQNQTLLEGWDDRELYYFINYEIDFDAMKPDAWNLIGQLLTFQEPDFGLPDELHVITYAFSLAIWLIVTIIAYTIITKLIPTISGGIEG